MSDENVEAFKRGMEAYNRRDVDAFLETFDPRGGIPSADPRNVRSRGDGLPGPRGFPIVGRGSG
jgi:hypothetical protein